MTSFLIVLFVVLVVLAALARAIRIVPQARAYIVERGRICFSGTMGELDARPDIRDAHLAL